jgi:hypothetical protein
MIPLVANPNVDNSDLVNYPNGRIRDNDSSGNGTPVNRSVYGDLHSNISKLMRLYDIVPNGLPDNETNGFEIIAALKALASKNDYIYPLTTNGTTTLNVDIKLSLMNENEFIVCLASADKTTETLIKGSGPVSMTVTYSGNFKTNEYVRVIKTVSGVSIIRIADWNSLDAMCAELLFLKKATQAEENAGSIDTVATTPLVNKVTFSRRVNGADSATYLATALQHGLYPKEHFAIVAAIGASPMKNLGWFAGLDIAGPPPGTSLAVGGNITAAVIFASGKMTAESFILVTMQNAMDNTDYYVRSFIESQGALNQDNDANSVVFKPISTTQFQIAIKESAGGAQSLKIHLEVVQL